MKKYFSISESLGFGWKTFKSHWKFWIVATLIMAAGSGSLSSIQGNTFSNHFSSDVYEESYNTEVSNNVKLLEKITSLEGRLQEVDPVYKQSAVQPPLVKTSDLPTTPELAPTPDDQLLMFVLVILGIIIVIPLAILLTAFVVILMTISTFFSMGYIRLCLDGVRGNTLKFETLLSEVSVRRGLKFLGLSLVLGFLIVIGVFFFIIPGIYFGTKYLFAPAAFVDKKLGVFDSLRYSAKLTDKIKTKLFFYGVVAFVLTILAAFALLIGAYVFSIVNTLATMYIYDKLKKQLELEEVPAVEVATQA